MCLCVSLQKLHDVVFQESPAAVVRRSLPALLAGAAPQPANRRPERQNVSLLFILSPSRWRAVLALAMRVYLNVLEASSQQRPSHVTSGSDD